MGEIDQGVALHRQGDIAAAEAVYRRVLNTEPDNPEALHLLGVIALQQGDAARAQRFIAKAVLHAPERGEFQRNLGLALMSLDRLDEAAASLRRAAELDPADVAALINLAALRLRQRAFDDSIALSERAVALSAQSLEAVTNLAMALRSRGRLSDAERWYRRAFELAPGAHHLQADLAQLLRRQGRAEEAIETLRQATAALPGDGAVRATLYHDLLRVADWGELPALGRDIDRLNAGAIDKGQGAPESAFLNVLRHEDASENFRIARSHALEIASRIGWAQGKLQRKSRQSSGRLRIGYLTADIWDHPTAHLASGLFTGHDRGRFEVFLYSYGPDDGSAYRRKLAGDAEHFVELAGMDTLAAAQRIADDAIDILVDLKGHTMDAWLEVMALRPAPIQLHWLGFPGSIGGDFLDYIIADPVVLPPATDEPYSEKIVRLPHCYQINDDRQPIGPLPSRAEAGLPAAAFVFCCFNHAHKIEPVMFDLWTDLLREVPGSVLWLLGGQALVERNLRAEAASRGIAPERLIFAPHCPKPAHLARLSLADLALDTRIYNGHTTSSDVLWAGVPLLALRGHHFASRVSASLLHAMGLDELIADSLPAYRDLALSLARDSTGLTRLRKKLANARKTTPLFDTARFIRNLERAYEVMGARRQKSLPADRIDIVEEITAAQRQQGSAVFARGSTQRAAKDNAGAEQSFRQALALDPALADAAYNLGNLLREAGRGGEAATAYRQALSARPSHAAASFNLGLTLSGLGDIEGAAAAYVQTIIHAPHLIQAHVNLTLALRELGRHEEALAASRAALALEPESPFALLNEALLLLDAGKPAEAGQRLEAILARDPDHAEALALLSGLLPRHEIGRGIALLGRAHALRPDDAEIAAALLNLRQNVCDWQGVATLAPLVDRQTDEAIRRGQRSAETPFSAVTRTEDPARHLAIARVWGQRYERQAAAMNVRLPDAEPSADGRIRIAYLGNNFHDSPIAQLLVGPFSCHGRERFRIAIYSYGQDDGSIYRRRIATHAEQFTDIAALSDADAAARIRAESADVLVDLNGYIKGSRFGIAALRPAPVQAAYFGYPGTTGAAFYDYVFADPIVAPPEHAAYFSEAICRMPGCYLPTDNQQAIAPESLTRAQSGLPEKAFVFGSFNQSYKIDAPMFGLWMRLLTQVKGSVLWLLRTSDMTRDNLRRAAGAAGVNPDRLIFADRWPKERHMRRLGLADLALDTRVYNGHVSSVDVLWAGLPLVALLGHHFAGRVAASLLTAIGLPELVAKDLAGYESLALDLARNSAGLAAIRARLADRRLKSPVFDSAGIARNLERAYAEMWRRHLAGEPVKEINL
jgi:predicted O-linked N-acetylglucosamine transferase (SPINDLY family)